MQSDELSFLRAEIDCPVRRDDRTGAQRERAEAGNAEGASGGRLRIHIGEPPIGGIAMETFPGANRRSRSLYDRATHRGGRNSDEWLDHLDLLPRLTNRRKRMHVTLVPNDPASPRSVSATVVRVLVVEPCSTIQARSERIIKLAYSCRVSVGLALPTGFIIR